MSGIRLNFFHGHGQLETLEHVTPNLLNYADQKDRGLWGRECPNLLNYGLDIENYEKGLRLIIGPDLLSFETAMIAKKYCFIAICFN